MTALDGQVALITGAGRGMGRAHAVLMAERGADIAVHDIDAAGAEETARRVRATGRRALVLVADITEVAAMAAAVARAEAELGRIDVLVNNAGIGAEPGGIEGVDEAWFERIFAVHVKGTFFTTQAVVPGMKARRAGKIVNISSMWAQTGNPTGATYCGAKAAVLGLTKAWAKEFAPWGINVNAVAPGGVVTEMTLRKGGAAYIAEKAKAVPLGRYADAVEVSYAVAFLAGAGADFVTGQVLPINGGQAIVGI